MDFSCYYDPRPTRVWSRVQNQCTFILPGGAPPATLAPDIAKGNILQYRANQMPLSAKQRYARVVHQLTPSRTKAFATQTATYSNPNTRRLQRVGTTAFPFPNNIVGAPNNPAGPFVAPVENPDGCPSTQVESFGSLVCGSRVNSCGGVIFSAPGDPILCFESSVSDVPGNKRLCWDTRLSTWNPRVRRTMSTSTSKFPENYKGLRSALVPRP
jgi:hypothetical protein